MVRQRIRGPLQPLRGDLQAGIIAAAAVSPYCKPGQSVAPIDFMPFARKERRGGQRMSNRQLAGVFQAAQQGFANSRKKRGKQQ